MRTAQAFCIFTGDMWRRYFFTRVTELDDRATNGGQPDDNVPNPTFSEWSDKLHEAEVK